MRTLWPLLGAISQRPIRFLRIVSVATKATRELGKGTGEARQGAKERAKANPSPSAPLQWPTHRAEPLGLERA